MKRVWPVTPNFIDFRMRLILFAALCISAALFFSTLKGSAASPSSGTLTPTSGTLSYSAGPFLVPNVTSNIPGNTQPQCNNLTPCDDYNLTVDLSTASQEFLDKHRIEVTISWPLAQADFDLYVLKGAAVVKDAATSADPEIAVFDPEPGTNTYKVRVAPFAPAGQSFTATIRFVEKSTTTTPPPPGGGEAPRFHTFLTPTGVGDDFGEPSIGANWLSGNIMFYGGFSADALRVRFDDSSSPAKVNWTQTPLNLAATARALGDPILYTDRQTGRTLVSQLEGGTKQSTTDYTEDDGATYKPTLGSGINSGVDHQTLGGGPFAAGAPPHTYPNAVYYCAQDVADANCALSIDGGITFGPAVPIYTADQCDGIHGHIKVAPDGTAYVPNAECGGLNSPVTLGSNQAVVVSENNGITWEVRHVPGTTASGEDPSIGIASDGTLYFGFVDGDGHPKATVSRDKGLTWTTPIDIGTAFDIRHAVFPVTVAGDPNRAAIGFIGTPAVGDPNDAATFKGVWHLYIATTYNGGQSWATVDATPDDPVQVGSVCRAGTLCGNDRNLLDFNDATVDKEGRILIGYADGCVAPACTAATAAEPPPYDTSRSAKGVITRQSGGKRMFAQYDPDPADPSAPAAPRVDNVTRSATGAGILIDWSEPDNGGSPISAYNVYRKSGADGAYSLLASVAPDKTAYTDAGGSEAESIYKVTATNSIGEGTSSGEFGVQMPTESACIAPGLTVVTDPAGDQTGTAQSDVRSVSVSEIYDPANSANKLYFTIKMADLSVVPPQARFTVFFKRGATEWYISMQSDVNTAAPGTPLYRYGHITVNPTTGTRTQNDDGRLDFGSYSPDGTIVMAISNPTKGTAADDLAFPPLVAGESITDVNAFTQQTVGVLLLATDTTGKGSYKLVGNASCQPNTAPVAALSATPQTGFAPHAVNFTGAGSTDADAGDSIATYRFDFGDGSPIVTQSSPTISHTYANAGEYAARLTVTDSRGKSSINVARSIINVAPPCNDNVALASSGAVASASSTLSPTKSYPASSAIDGSNTGLNWGKGGGWSDKTRDAYPDWLQVDFNGGKRINEVRVYSLQDDFRQPRVPTADMTSTLYGLIDFDVQYFDAATNSWATVPNGAVRGNNKVVSIIRGLNITTSRIRVLVLNARDQHSRIVEVEAYGCNAQ